MKLQCLYNGGNYWFSPYFKISEVLEIGKIYEGEDGGRYPEWGRDFDHYLIDTKYCSKNFPAAWFKVVD